MSPIQERALLISRIAFLEKHVVAERDELARQLEEARRLACHYADLLHLAHGSHGMIEADWKAR